LEGVKVKIHRHYFAAVQRKIVEFLRRDLENARPEDAAAVRAQLEHEEKKLEAIGRMRIFESFHRAEPICDHPEDAGIETLGGLRLCCNPEHYKPVPSYGPVWHRIKDWPAAEGGCEARVLYLDVPTRKAKP
jgi:hypothetical protein